jgi:ABC-type Fe3+-hydroxamate transport system substrate-binding protein
MKYISALLSHLSPVRVLLSVLLSAVLLFSSACSDSVPAKNTSSMTSSSSAKSPLTKGTVQLDEIEKKAEKAIDSPANSLETIVERSKGSLNEVQSGAADSKKMITSSDTKLPVIEQAEKAIKNMKKG